MNPFPSQHQGDANHRPHQGTDEYDERDGLPAKKRAHHGQQLDVAASHAFLFRQQLVTVRDQEEAAAANDNSDKGVLPPEQLMRGGQIGYENDAAKPMTIPGMLMQSGMIWCSRSMKVMTTRAEQSRKSAAKVMEKLNL